MDWDIDKLESIIKKELMKEKKIGEYWKNASGKRVLIDDMDINYVLNCINLVFRHRPDVKEFLQKMGFLSKQNIENEIDVNKVRILKESVKAMHEGALIEDTPQTPKKRDLTTKEEYKAVVKKMCPVIFKTELSKEDKKLLMTF